MLRKRELMARIEWEFLIPQSTSPTDPHSTDDRFYMDHEWQAHTPLDQQPRNLHDVLHHHLQDLVPIIHRALPRNTDAVAAQWNINRHAEGPCTRSFWQIASASTPSAIPAEDIPMTGYRYPHGIALHSRLLDSFQHRQTELDAVYTRVRNTLRVHTNSSCALHVHINTPRWALLRYKKLITLVMVGEAFLYRLCEAHRAWSPFARPVASECRFAETAAMRGGAGPPVVDRGPMKEFVLDVGVVGPLVDTLRAVWMARNVDELRRGLGTGLRERCGLAICGGERTWDAFCTTTMEEDWTLEFRYSHSSGDPVRDAAWIRVCAALARAACFDDKFVGAALRGFVAGGELRNFLVPIGLGSDVAFWEHKTAEYRDRAANPQPPQAFLLRLVENLEVTGS